MAGRAGKPTAGSSETGKKGVASPVAAPVAVALLDRTSSAVAKPINAATGGVGGNVILVAGVLFLAYLYLTRRLPGVVSAIALPPGVSGEAQSQFPLPGSLEEATQGGSQGRGQDAPRPVDPTRDRGYETSPGSQPWDTTSEWLECVKHQTKVGQESGLSLPEASKRAVKKCQGRSRDIYRVPRGAGRQL